MFIVSFISSFLSYPTNNLSSERISFVLLLERNFTDTYIRRVRIIYTVNKIGVVETFTGNLAIWRRRRGLVTISGRFTLDLRKDSP